MKHGWLIGALTLALLVSGVATTALADVTVFYDSNGGTPDFGAMTLAPDGAGVVNFDHPSTEPTRSGYRFLGWLCQDEPRYYPLDPAGKNVRYAMRDSTLCYTAQWMPDSHPSYAPYMVATALYSDGTVYDVIEGQWKCVQRSEDTYYCLHNWYNATGDYTGIVDGSGYAGFQYKQGKTWTILSVWGNDHGSPTVEYSRPGSVAEPFGGEGVGMHVLTEYPWDLFTWYTMRIQARSENGRTYYDQYVKPENGDWELIASISYPMAGLGFTWDCFFQEDWSANNLPRSCLIRNYCARRLNDQGWKAVYSFQMANHLAGTGEQNVRYDCAFENYGADAVWIQSGGDGYDVKADSMPAELKVSWSGQPVVTGFLR